MFVEVGANEPCQLLPFRLLRCKDDRPVVFGNEVSRDSSNAVVWIAVNLDTIRVPQSVVAFSGSSRRKLSTA